MCSIEHTFDQRLSSRTCQRSPIDIDQHTAGVATRPLGHTGRALVAAPLTTVAYAILSVGVLVRILSPLATGWYLTLIDVAAAAWLVAFGLFTVVYWPILTQPRKA